VFQLNRIQRIPIFTYAIVPVCACLPIAIAPAVVAESGRITKLSFSDVGAISAKCGVVGERGPGDRIVAVAKPQKSIVGRSASIVRTNRPEVDQHKAAIATSASPTRCCAGLDSFMSTCRKTQASMFQQGSTLGLTVPPSGSKKQLTGEPNSPPTARYSPPSVRYAAWVRTGRVALAIGAKKPLAGLLPDLLNQLTRSVLVLFSAFCFGAAVWRDLRPGASPPKPDEPQLPRSVLLALSGLLALVALWAAEPPSHRFEAVP
jgi:hypothetical protein